MINRDVQYKVIFSTIFLFIFALGFFAFTTTSDASMRAMISLDPKYPKPGDEVTAKLTLYGVNKGTAYVTWILDGKVVLQQYSADIYKFTAGHVGSIINIGYVVQNPSGESVAGETSVRVGDLKIVWEGKTYTPLFYKGRSMFSGGAEVVASAVPEISDSSGKVYTKEELFYSWSVGGPQNKPTISGRGQHTVVLKNTRLYDPFKIYVQISDPKGNVRNATQVLIPFTQPVLELYEDSPYVGIYYGRAIAPVYGVFGSEATLIAEPYHMIASSRIDPILEYDWNIGTNKYSSPGSISFGAEGPGYGSTNLSLIVKSKESVMQNARINKRIDYGERGAWRETTEETLPL